MTVSDRDRRRHPRIAVRADRFTAAFRLADGTIGSFRVDPRNVSVSGAGFILARAVEPGSSCDLALPTRSGELVAIPAVVRRCNPMALALHDVGVEFLEELDAATFDELDLAIE